MPRAWQNNYQCCRNVVLVGAGSGLIDRASHADGAGDELNTSWQDPDLSGVLRQPLLRD